MRRVPYFALSLALCLPLAGRAWAVEDLETCYKGSAAQQDGQHDLAISFYNQCIEWGDLTLGNLAIVLYNRGTSRQLKGDFEGADAVVTVLVSIDLEIGEFFFQGLSQLLKLGLVVSPQAVFDVKLHGESLSVN